MGGSTQNNGTTKQNKLQNEKNNNNNFSSTQNKADFISMTQSKDHLVLTKK